MGLPDEFYDKYFGAYDSFRQGLDDKAASTINLNMHRAARVLSGTPLSMNFANIVKAVEASDSPEQQKTDVLREEARTALLQCGKWHYTQ